MSKAAKEVFEDEGSMEEEEEEEITDLSDPVVVQKYRTASEIANQTLKTVASKCTPGADINKLCVLGDALIKKALESVYKKDKMMMKGIAFPTNISPNEKVCHFCPLPSESIPVSAGDILKIDLGVHVDGFIACVATTIVVPKEGEPEMIPEEVSRVFHAADLLQKGIPHLMKPEMTNQGVTAFITRVCEMYGVHPIQGTLSHVQDKHMIDGPKVILQREDPEHKVEDAKFELNEVYGLDIALSSGEGKPRETEDRCAIFKRDPDETYRLKLKASHYVLKVINDEFAYMPFALRSFDDEKQARFGITECLKHGLVHPYPVVAERAGDVVVHVKFLVLIQKNGIYVTAGVPLDLTRMAPSTVALPEDIATLLAEPLVAKKAKEEKKE